MSGQNAQVRLGVTVSTIYTLASGTGQITAADITEKTGAGNNVTVYVANSGDDQTSDNTAAYVQAITANGNEQIAGLVGHILTAGQSILAVATTADTTVLRISVNVSTE